MSPSGFCPISSLRNEKAPRPSRRTGSFQLIKKVCAKHRLFLINVFSRTCAGKKHRNPPILPHSARHCGGPGDPIDFRQVNCRKSDAGTHRRGRCAAWKMAKPARGPEPNSAAAQPRPFRAAPQVRRLTEGARGSGDRSLSNEKGALQKRSFCGETKPSEAVFRQSQAPRPQERTGHFDVTR